MMNERMFCCLFIFTIYKLEETNLTHCAASRLPAAISNFKVEWGFFCMLLNQSVHRKYHYDKLTPTPPPGLFNMGHRSIRASLLVRMYIFVHTHFFLYFKNNSPLASFLVSSTLSSHIQNVKISAWLLGIIL